MALATITLSVLIWYSRRPEQLFHPYVWQEEADWLQLFQAHGWSGSIVAVNGYFELPTNLLVDLAARLSFVHLPVVESLLATGVFLLTVCMIVIPDSHYGSRRVRCAFALTMALVPVNPETFGVLLYSLWWATLWPVIILGWRRRRYAARLPLLLAASLSSPGGGALLVIYLFAFLRHRRRQDLVSAIVLAVGFGVELTTIARSARGAAVTQATDIGNLVEQCLRTGGFYLFRWDLPATGASAFLAFTGLVLVMVLGAVAALLRRQADHVPLLLATTVLFTVLSGQPYPLITDPLTVGRYYFLPFITLTWLLISIATSTSLPTRFSHQVSGFPILRIGACGLIGLSLLGLPAAFSRSPLTTTARLSWPKEVRRCDLSTKAHVAIPVYIDGSSTAFWSDVVTPAACRRLSHEGP